ncbi:MAG: GNAT family N-acetyltransferase [Oscillospiraceae bacterium]|nr:GNAT family N-acetyltransferase [Oscillospiraceae bacterium]
MTIHLRPLAAPDLRTLQNWFSDVETAKRLGGMLPLEAWFANTKDAPNHKSQLATDGNLAIGMTTVETYDDNSAGVSILINPKQRNRGHGKRVVAEALKQLPNGTAVHAYIDADNPHSAALFAALGFRRNGIDPDGLTDFVYIK